MKPMRMHHVGVVLPTVEQAERLMELFGLEVDYRGYVKSYHATHLHQVRTQRESHRVHHPPRGGAHPLQRRKRRHRHIAFEVDDVEAASRELEAAGLEMLEKEAVEGTSDIIVNFLRPRYSEGILFELVQTVGPIDRSGGDPARE